MATTDITYAPLITEEDQTLAKTMVEAILRSGNFRLEADGQTFVVPSSAAKQILSVLNLTAESLPAEVIPAIHELSVEQAAKYLKTSERHLNDLLDQDMIRSRLVDGKRMVFRDSMVEFDQERERGFAILAALTQEAQDMGLYDD